MKSSKSSTTVMKSPSAEHRARATVTVKPASLPPSRTASLILNDSKSDSREKFGGHLKKLTAEIKNSATNLGSPNDDWQLWYRPPTTAGHHLSAAERQEKRSTVRRILDSNTTTPNRIDAARLKNVLTELHVHFRVTVLLPVLLASEDKDKLELLGENVNRALTLIRLQTELAINILTESSIPENASEASSSSSVHSVNRVDTVYGDSDLSGPSISRVDVKEMQLSKEEKLNNRLSLAATSKLFSFKEAFYSLCVAFRDTCDYDLLVKAERLFDGPLAAGKMMPVARQLCGLIADVMQILLNGIEATPFEVREIQKVIAHMTELNTAAEETMRLLWDDFKKILDENQTEHDHLTKNIAKNQKIITARLTELHDVRMKAQSRLHRQAEDDNGSHRQKLVKMQLEIVETQKLVDGRNKQYLRLEKDYLKQMRDAKAVQTDVEVAILERCVVLKTEIIALQDRGEILREYLHKDLKEEKVLEDEMNELLKDRQERDERRRISEMEARRQNQAASLIQKVFRGFMVRKKLKKKKKGKKGKKKEKSKKG